MVNDLMKMIQNQISDDQFISSLSQQLGETDKAKTAAAAGGIASILTGALARNASTSNGASALASALDRDHDGSILNDVMGMLAGGGQTGGNRMLNGAGILGHILGCRQSGASDMISTMSGLDKGKTMQLMMMMAPMIMGMLGKTKRQRGLDSGGLSDLLSGAFGQQRTQANNPAMDVISGFLDQDNDGDISDDIANLGKGLLGGLFGRR